ncbi:hypothetical protein ABMA27_002420 [Loxostege sticticalis]|uniref:DUF4780 domain-containing protein n=1 Tax=Loxostege sticticalis TaxID=481309 RepID=A0ABR3HTL4_LOXSC
MDSESKNPTTPFLQNQPNKAAPGKAPSAGKARSSTKLRQSEAARTVEPPTNTNQTTRPGQLAPTQAATPSVIEMSALLDAIPAAPAEPTWTIVPPRRKNTTKAKPHPPGKKSNAEVAAGNLAANSGRRTQTEIEPATAEGITADPVPSEAKPKTSAGAKPRRRPRQRHRNPRGRGAGPAPAASHASPGPSQSQHNKRPRPDDTVTPTGDSKRPRRGTKQEAVSYAEALRANQLCVAVMTSPHHDLTADQATVIRKSVEQRLMEGLLCPATTVQFGRVRFRGKAHFSDGVLKLWCEDDYTLAWLRSTVDAIASPIVGATLVVRPQAEIQRRILCGLFVPDDNELEINTLRRLLAAHNPKVAVNSWSLVRAERQSDQDVPGVHLLLRVPEKDVDHLRKEERRMYWLCGNIYLKIMEDVPPPASTTNTPVKAEDPNPAQPTPMEEALPSTSAVEDYFRDDGGSDCSESCLDSSPLRE